MNRLATRLTPRNTVLLVCDMQEKFRQNIKYFPEIVVVTRRLIDASKILKVPIIATEQYPKGLGHSVAELDLKSADAKIFEKCRFSMCTSDVLGVLKETAAENVLLCGIESHVCVYQTALELLEREYNVHLVVDAASSRSMTDRLVAFRTLERNGVTLTTSECAILGLLGGSDHPDFRQVQKIIMETAPDTGLAAGLARM